MSPPSDPPPRHLSSFHLEALRMGAASNEERAWVEQHLAACAQCASLAREIEGYRQEFATGALPRTRAAVRQAIARRPHRRLWMLAALAPVAAAAGYLMLARPAPRPDDQPAVSAKGGPSLAIVVRRGERVFPAAAGARVQPGDQIRFVLLSLTHRYVLIASVDSAGHANIYAPYDGKESAPVTPGDRVEMDGSIVLDAQLGPERIYALFSRAPLKAEGIRKSLAAIGAGGPRSIRGTASLEVSADAQASVLLEKIAR